MTIPQLEALERQISRERGKLHERIDWLRGSGGSEATIAGMVDRERKLSDRRRAVHRAIDEARAKGAP